MTHTIITTFGLLSLGATFYPPNSERAFEFIKESDTKYSTTYNGKREVFKAAPNEEVEATFEM